MASKKIPNRQKTPKRKPKKEEWHLSRNGKIGLIAGAAALVLIAVIWIVSYNAQALALNAEGKIDMPEGSHWLVYNEKTQQNPRYLKLGEVSPAAGYKLDKQDSLSDPNEPIYYFAPESDAQPRLTYSAMLGRKGYLSIAESTISTVPSMLKDPETSQLKTAKLSGRDVAYYIYTGGATDPQNPEKITNYVKRLAAYVAAPNDRCVVLLFEQKLDTNEGYADDAAFEALLEHAVAGLTI